MNQDVLVAGVDEAGRGPLAGPVVAAAVILDPANPIDGLTDSKKLSEKKREQLFDQIHRSALAVGVGYASAAEIDSINILQASLLAMHRAVVQLTLQPGMVLVDGNKLPAWEYPSKAIIQGDLLEPAISAASIVAKVTRDRELLQYDEQYPDYGFAQHKGYPTKQHLAAIEAHGVLPVHRRSFGPVARKAGF